MMTFDRHIIRFMPCPITQDIIYSAFVDIVNICKSVIRQIGRSYFFHFIPIQTVATIVGLFTRSRPTAIFGAISFIVVNSIKRQMVCVTILQSPFFKKLKTEKFARNVNAPMSVAFKFPRFWIATPLLHAVPYFIKSGICAPMRSKGFAPATRQAIWGLSAFVRAALKRVATTLTDKFKIGSFGHRINMANKSGVCNNYILMV